MSWSCSYQLPSSCERMTCRVNVSMLRLFWVQMQLLTQIRLAMSFSDYDKRLQCVQARLQAISTLGTFHTFEWSCAVIPDLFDGVTSVHVLNRPVMCGLASYNLMQTDICCHEALHCCLVLVSLSLDWQMSLCKFNRSYMFVWHHCQLCWSREVNCSVCYSNILVTWKQQIIVGSAFFCLAHPTDIIFCEQLRVTSPIRINCWT